MTTKNEFALPWQRAMGNLTDCAAIIDTHGRVVVDTAHIHAKLKRSGLKVESVERPFAELIVRAVNSHGELLALLEEACTVHNRAEWLQRAGDVLAKARGDA